jgi:peptide/nickel transport system substrate-binding protein
MENRFGLKDLFLFVILIVLVGLVGLAMVQVDRQWRELRTMREQSEQQIEILGDLRRILAAGVRVADGGATTRPADGTGPFARVLAARAMPDYAEGDWHVWGLGGGLKTITPLVSGDANASAVQGLVLETLCTRDPETLEWSGLLASEWSITDNVAAWDAYVEPRLKVPLTEEEILKEPEAPPADKPEDRKAYVEQRMKEGRRPEQAGAEPEAPPAIIIEFTLRDGLTFSDGHPLTVDDVVFTFNFLMDERIAAPRHRAYFRTIRKVEKTADNKVAFYFREPYFEAFELAASMEVLPQHFYSQFEPEKFNKSVGYLMGSGPYKLPDPKSWKSGEPLNLVRNDRYWGVQPGFDRMVFREFTNDVARLTAFRNGDTDVFGATPEQYEEMMRDASLKARTHQYAYQNPVGGYRYIAWNQVRGGKPTPFADKRVRQAMTLLTDRERLIQDIMLGHAVIATGPFNPQSKQANPGIQPWPHDPARAMQLLTEAGYTDRNNEGVLRGPDGRPLSFKLTYPSGSANYDRMVLRLKDMYARAKVQLIPDPKEWSVFTDILQNKDFDAITLGWTAGIETDIYQMFHSSQMIPGGDNFMSYNSPELDRVIREARRTLDESKRMPMWHKAHEILHEDQPYTFLFFGKSLVFIDGRISNIQLLKLGLNPREEWYVPKAKQRWTR